MTEPEIDGVPPSPWLTYRDGTLHCEGVSLAELAQQAKTPLYVYSGGAIDEAYHTIDRAVSFMPHLVAYAVKANGNLGVLARIARAGGGADIVSGGELARAREAGFEPERIVFSGVGKTDEEIAAALEAGIRSLHVESAPEIDAVEQIAKERGVRAPIALRVNPDVDPNTHPYIATGLHGSKFGIELDVARRMLPRLLQSEHLRLEGVACHIGSQLPSPEPLRDAVRIVGRFARECAEAGAPIRTLDAGGGWPVWYGSDTERRPPPMSDYGQAIRRGLEQADVADLGLDLVVEPGRSLMANAGVLLGRVIFIKQRPRKTFVIVDAAMTELLRPAIYDAYHAIQPVAEPPPGATLEPVDVVGPVCETGDFLALDRALPQLERHDLVAIRGAGAYAACMASNYNARPRPAEVLVDGDTWRVVREREWITDLWRGEHV